MAMVRIGLVLHPRRNSSAAVRQVQSWTSTHGVELVAAADDVLRLGVDGVVPVEVPELAGSCDGMIALGGDGTLLGAMRLVSGRPVPVLGVNLGRLGFLAEVEGPELDAALEALAEGRARTESRPCLVLRSGERGRSRSTTSSWRGSPVPGWSRRRCRSPGSPTGTTAATR